MINGKCTLPDSSSDLPPGPRLSGGAQDCRDPVVPPTDQKAIVWQLCVRRKSIVKKLVLLCCGGLALMAVSAFMFSSARTEAAMSESAVNVPGRVDFYPGFEVQSLVNGRPLEEYSGRGRTYVEA